MYKDIEIDMKKLPEGLLNLQKIILLEKNVLNYLYHTTSNIIQLVDIVIENPLIEEEHDQYNTPVTSNVSGEGNDDCITQYSGKRQDKNAETFEESL